MDVTNKFLILMMNILCSSATSKGSLNPEVKAEILECWKCQNSVGCVEFNKTVIERETCDLHQPYCVSSTPGNGTETILVTPQNDGRQRRDTVVVVVPQVLTLRRREKTIPKKSPKKKKHQQESDIVPLRRVRIEDKRATL